MHKIYICGSDWVTLNTSSSHTDDITDAIRLRITIKYTTHPHYKWWVFFKEMTKYVKNVLWISMKHKPPHIHRGLNKLTHDAVYSNNERMTIKQRFTQADLSKVWQTEIV